MARRLRLGIDFDGVISDTIAAMIDYASAVHGIDLAPHECLVPAGPARLGVEAYQALIADAHGTEYALGMPAIPGALEAIADHGARRDAVIVTARGGSAFDHTSTWLARAGLRDVLQDVVSSRGVTKAEVATRLGLDVLLDDVPANPQDLPRSVVPASWSAVYNDALPVGRRCAASRDGMHSRRWSRTWRPLARLSRPRGRGRPDTRAVRGPRSWSSARPASACRGRTHHHRRPVPVACSDRR